MEDYKSVQELIWKAIKHDRISVTVSPSYSYEQDVVQFAFTMNDRRSVTNIDTVHINEEATLYELKRTLRDLFMYPYDSINVRVR